MLFHLYCASVKCYLLGYNLKVILKLFLENEKVFLAEWVLHVLGKLNETCLNIACKIVWPLWRLNCAHYRNLLEIRHIVILHKVYSFWFWYLWFNLCWKTVCAINQHQLLLKRFSFGVICWNFHTQHNNSWQQFKQMKQKFR